MCNSKNFKNRIKNKIFIKINKTKLNCIHMAQSSKEF